MRYPITIIQGAQFGSEAKGAVAGALALRLDYDYAVRTGAINAGHTVYYKGKPYAMQQLPVAWVNPDTKLVIGPGAYVHLPTLAREIEMVGDATGEDVTRRLYVDHRVGVHLDSYSEESKTARRHSKIGATGKGCAEAIIHKIKDRGDDDLLLVDYMRHNSFTGPWEWCDAPRMLTCGYDDGDRIMLEGTQGELLDFHLGPWPYVTSRQTTAAAWVAEAGLSPSLEYEIVLVARTYPIRVAGNSGPLPNEITWPILARQIRTKLASCGIGSDHPLWVDERALARYEDAVSRIGVASGVEGLVDHHLQSEAWRKDNKSLLSEYASRAVALCPDAEPHLRRLFEFTTVTKKLRRVALLNRDGLMRTIDNLVPGIVVMTFINYEYPELHGRTSLSSKDRNSILSRFEFCHAVTTGPGPEHLIWLR